MDFWNIYIGFCILMIIVAGAIAEILDIRQYQQKVEAAIQEQGLVNRKRTFAKWCASFERGW